MKRESYGQSEQVRPERIRARPAVVLRCVMMPVFVDTRDGAPVADRDILRSKELLTPNEAAYVLRISVSKIYELCAKDVLTSVKIGFALRIRTRSLLKLLEQ